MNFIVIPGSLRVGSLNKILARWAAQRIGELRPGTTATFIDLQPLQIPVYDGDIEAVGIPQSINILAQQIASADGLVIVTPEYNGSIAAPVKNLIDWLSRIKPMPLAAKPVQIFAASPGALGGVRGLWHTRVPFEVLGSHVMPGMVGVGQANTKLSGENTLNDAAAQKQLDQALENFLNLVQSLKKNAN